MTSEEKPQRKVKPTVVFVLGGPGAGKGTQCANIVERCAGWHHISAGDCLRAERNNPDSKDGQLINDIIKEGKIVPVAITVKLLIAAMEAAEGKTKFLIDGFPRNLDNVTGWRENVGSKARVAGVLFFEASEEEMEKRLLKRGETSGRSDDNADAIKKRFKTYMDETAPIVDSYRKKKLVYSVNGMREVEEVWADVKKVVTDIENGVRPLVLRKPRFMDVKKIHPESSGVNIKVKVLEVKDDNEVLVGDESGSCILKLSGEAPDFMKKGASIRVQNARSIMVNSFIRVQVNKWAKAAPLDEALEFEANEKNNISAVEFELVK
eukprot:TRINITY_DN68080_c0_g1_i1.p1 TRINITY_DN68080_c0_g1~~TRINITY_DN68080_c0_g1_i1.p1  ORF type:complete len:345 (-),score=84.44 TRINITY_DN68080_c0_g1_i1:128-1093(-)